MLEKKSAMKQAAEANGDFEEYEDWKRPLDNFLFDFSKDLSKIYNHTVKINCDVDLDKKFKEAKQY